MAPRNRRRETIYGSVGAGDVRYPTLPRLTRNSLLFSQETPCAFPETQDTQQTAGREDAENSFAQQQREILEQLPAEEDNDQSLPEDINLAQHLYDDDLDEQDPATVAIDYEDETGTARTARVPFNKLHNLDVDSFANHVSQYPDSTHYILRRLQHDHREALRQVDVLQKANDLNREKFEHLAAQLKATTQGVDAQQKKSDKAENKARDLEHQLQTVNAMMAGLQQNHTALQKEKDSLGGAQKKVAEWRQWCKEEEKKATALKRLNDELQARVQALESEMEVTYTETDFKRLRDEVKQLKVHLEEANRGRSSTQQGGGDRRSSESRSASRRRRGEEAPPPPPSPEKKSKSKKDKATGGDDDPRSSDDSSDDDSKDPKKKPSKNSGSKKKPITLSEDEDDEVNKAIDVGDVVPYYPFLKEAFRTSKEVQVTKFNNSTTISYQSWLLELSNKLAVSRFRDVPAVLNFIMSCLSSTPQTMVAPRIPASIKLGRTANVVNNDMAFKTAREMIAFLDDNYASFNPIGDARHAMDILKMKDDEKFSDFFTKYQDINARIPWHDDDMGRADQIHQLFTRLNVKYKNGLKLQRYNTPGELVQLCQKYQQDQSVIDELHPRTKKEPEDYKKSSGKTTTQSTTTNSGKKPWKDRPEKYKNLPRMNNEIRAQLDKEGRCRRCREEGHGPKDEKCPLFEYEGLLQKTTTTTSTERSGKA